LIVLIIQCPKRSSYFNISVGSRTSDAATTPRVLELDGRIANAYTVFLNGQKLGAGYNSAHGYGTHKFTIPLTEQATSGTISVE
jgi:hypothetical protein